MQVAEIFDSQRDGGDKSGSIPVAPVLVQMSIRVACRDVIGLRLRSSCRVFFWDGFVACSTLVPLRSPSQLGSLVFSGPAWTVSANHFGYTSSAPRRVP
jgi:hypothetical protein